MAESSPRLRRNWVSSVELGEMKHTNSSPHLKCAHCFHCHVTSGQKDSHSAAYGSSTSKEFNEPRTKRTMEANSWANDLTLTINNLSKECLDRLTKLESENNELRKQYQSLEARIASLIKSSRPHERLQFPCKKPLENGKSAHYELSHGWYHFDSQIRQLISILARTNIAQNDIREDCRYLKHRVSNLEEANSRLCDLVKQKYPGLMQSCQNLCWIEPRVCQSPDKALNSGCPSKQLACCDDSMKINENRKRHVELFRGSLPPSKLMEDCNGGKPHASDLSNGEDFVSVKNHNLSKTPPGSLTRVRCSPPTNQHEETEKSTEKEILDGNGLATVAVVRSTMPPPLSSDKCIAQIHFLSCIHSPYTDPPDRKRDASRSILFHMNCVPVDMSVETTDTKDSSTKVPTTQPIRSLNLLPCGWEQLPSILTSDQRFKNKDRSDLTSGAKMLQLITSTTVNHRYKSLPPPELCKPTCWMDDTLRPSVKAISLETASQNETVVAYQPSVAKESNASANSCYAAIEESKLPRSYVQPPSDIDHTEVGASSNVAGRLIKGPSPDTDRKILYRDPKLRYLHSHRCVNSLLSPGVSTILSRRQRSIDLETSVYQQEQLQKFRDAQRNLRYGVFSDTELLTGKFTITSTDDSAIDAEDGVSSKESLRQDESCIDKERPDANYVTLRRVASKEWTASAVEGIPSRDQNIAAASNPDELVGTAGNSVNVPTSTIDVLPKEGNKCLKKHERDVQASPHSAGGEANTSSEDDCVPLSTEHDPVRSHVPPPVVIHRKRFGTLEVNESTCSPTSAKCNGSETPDFGSTMDLVNASHAVEEAHRSYDIFNPFHKVQSIEESVTPSKTKLSCSTGNPFTGLTHTSLEVKPPLLYDTPVDPSHRRAAIKTMRKLSPENATVTNTDISENSSEPPWETSKKFEMRTSSELCKAATKIPNIVYDGFPHKPCLHVHNEATGIKESHGHSKEYNSVASSATPSVSRGPISLQRPATSPRNRRTLGLSNTTGTVTESKSSNQKTFSSNSCIPSKSSPNSPELVTGIRNYRSHLHPSVVKISKLSTSTFMLSGSIESNSNDEGQRDKTPNGRLASQPSVLRTETITKCPVSSNCDESSNGFQQNPAEAASSPPPIPPRTTSRTQGSQPKITNLHLPAQADSTNASRSPTQGHFQATHIKSSPFGSALRSCSRGQSTGMQQTLTNDTVIPKKRVTIAENGPHRSVAYSDVSKKHQMHTSQIIHYSMGLQWTRPKSSVSSRTPQECKDQSTTASPYASGETRKNPTSSSPHLQVPQDTGISATSQHPPLTSRRPLDNNHPSTMLKRDKSCNSPTTRLELIDRLHSSTPTSVQLHQVTRWISSEDKNSALTPQPQATIRYVPHSYK